MSAFNRLVQASALRDAREAYGEHDFAGNAILLSKRELATRRKTPCKHITQCPSLITCGECAPLFETPKHAADWLHSQALQRRLVPTDLRMDAGQPEIAFLCLSVRTAQGADMQLIAACKTPLPRASL